MSAVKLNPTREMELSTLEHRLASLESTLLPAEAAVQPLLKSVQAMVQRLNEIQDRSMAEFFEKCTSDNTLQRTRFPRPLSAN